MSIQYSVVIPAHDEAQNLPVLIRKIDQTFQVMKSSYEIIAVNDNSHDDSHAVLEELKKEVLALRPLNRTTHPGVGNAIRDGLAQAKGEIIVTLDGDLSHDPDEIPLLLKRLENFDMVCGSRYVKGGKADMTLSRVVISGVFNFIFRGLIGLPVRDFTSGFRVYRRQIIDTIHLKNQQFGIYIEIPIKAYLARFKITEYPITYHKRQYGITKLNYLKQGPEYLKVAAEALMMKLKNGRRAQHL